MRISAAGDAGSAPIMQRPGQASSHCSSTNHFRSLSEHRLVRIADHAALAALLPWKWKLAQTRLATRGCNKSQGTATMPDAGRP